jgi:hypothetical protein
MDARLSFSKTIYCLLVLFGSFKIKFDDKTLYEWVLQFSFGHPYLPQCSSLAHERSITVAYYTRTYISYTTDIVSLATDTVPVDSDIVPAASNIVPTAEVIVSFATAKMKFLQLQIELF